MTRRLLFLAIIVLAINFVSSSTVLSCGQPSEGIQAPKADANIENFIEGHYWALIIGIDKYPTLGPDRQLETARKDAEAVAALLVERYGFEKERMVELYDEKATRKEIIRSFSELTGDLTDKDSLFIYYAGRGDAYVHSYKEQSEKQKVDSWAYWLPSDARLDDPSSFIFDSQVTSFIADNQARHIFLVVDSDFHAKMGRTRRLSKAAIKELYLAKSRWALVSGGLSPVPDSSKNGFSVFTWHFINFLEKNAQPYLLAKDIAEPIAVRVSSEVQGMLPRSAPLLGTGDEGGQFVFRLKQEFIRDKQQFDLCLPIEGSLESLEEQLKKQQEEMAKKKQEMLERIKKAE